MAENRRVIYTARAHVTGGRADGHGRTSDGALEVDLRLLEEIGGSGGGANPEQLFAVGYAACFKSSLGAVARRRRPDVGDVAIDSRVMLIPTVERKFRLAVDLAVTLPSVADANEVETLIRAAQERCPYSNATRGNIGVTLTVNGRDIETRERRQHEQDPRRTGPHRPAAGDALHALRAPLDALGAPTTAGRDLPLQPLRPDAHAPARPRVRR